MKQRRLLKVLLALIVMALIVAGLVVQTDQGIQKKLEQTRRELRAQGFKTELSDFDLSVSPDVARRAKAVVAIGENTRVPRQNTLELMVPVDTNTARVAWRQSKLPTQMEEDLWPVLSLELAMQQSALDDACRELLSGSIAFPITTFPNGDLQLSAMAPARAAAGILAASVIADLHSDNPEDAWRSLLALTRFATAWKTEPTTVSHLVRFTIVDYAQAAAWEALQRGGWTDEQLSTLQREWDGADFLSGLPDTVALSRACEAARLRADRESFTFEPGAFIHELIESPDRAWNELRGLILSWRFCHYDSYAREIALLLSSRDYESNMAAAIKLPAWTAMLTSGVTNSPGVQLTRGMSAPGPVGLAASGSGDMKRSLLGRAAEAEATRRIAVVAIALERYRRLTGTYPETLADLSPRFLKSVPRDFIDGNPLHYERVGDGQFVLYSPGVDGLDNGGVLKRLIRDRSFRDSGVDLVWPRAAAASEVENFNQALDIARRARKGEQVNVPENLQVPPYLRREFRSLLPSPSPE